MPELPKGFRYQGFDWRIEESNALLEGKGQYAETIWREHLVRIGTNVPESQVARSLLHELCHIADNDMLPQDAPTENIIRVISYGLYAILVDNPELRHFIWPTEEGKR